MFLFGHIQKDLSGQITTEVMYMYLPNPLRHG